MQKLNDLRQKINLIDKQIVSLLAERKEISIEIGMFKKEHGLPVLDSTRENELLQEYEMLAKKSALDPAFVKTIFKLIHDKSKELQQ